MIQIKDYYITPIISIYRSGTHLLFHSIRINIESFCKKYLLTDIFKNANTQSNVFITPNKRIFLFVHPESLHLIPNIRKAIFLYRKDKIKQAISYIVAKTLNNWEQLDYLHVSNFDKRIIFSKIKPTMQNLSRKQDYVHSYLRDKSINFIKISYEELVNNFSFYLQFSMEFLFDFCPININFTPPIKQNYQMFLDIYNLYKHTSK